LHEICLLCLIRQVVATRKEGWDVVTVFSRTVLPQVLAEACFRRQLAVTRKMVVKLIRSEIVGGTFQVSDVKPDMEVVLEVALGHFCPTHLLNGPSIKWLNRQTLAEDTGVETRFIVSFHHHHQVRVATHGFVP